MKRWLVNLTIVAYLGALSWGITSHSLKVGRTAHPAMYFLIWDMFCGWTSWELRYHVIGEGLSGSYYELDPPPWGEFSPFGNLGRRHFDVPAAFAGRSARNTLRHTDHEPIVRMFVVEEWWAKKYNLPDEIWEQRFDEPKDPRQYYNVRYVLDADGRAVQAYPSWLIQQYAYSLSNNPRLVQEARRRQPFLLSDSAGRVNDGPLEPRMPFDPSALAPSDLLPGYGN